MCIGRLVGREIATSVPDSRAGVSALITWELRSTGARETLPRAHAQISCLHIITQVPAAAAAAAAAGG